MNAGVKQRLRALLEPHKRKLVARVMERRDAAGDAVYDLAANHKTVWTLREWAELLHTMANSTQTIGEWLDTLWAHT